MSSRSPYSRRDMLRLTASLSCGLALSALGQNVRGQSEHPAEPSYEVRTAEAALQKLLNGSQRYLSGESHSHPRRSTDRRQAVVNGQTPFAAILGCSDSRVPTEILFDQGMGDLFVVRVAGHVVDRSTLGSIEYAVSELNVPLIMVLGHEQCGAIGAALKFLEQHQSAPEYLRPLVEKIKPAVLQSQNESGDRMANAIRANVHSVVHQLENSGSVIGEPFQRGEINIVGAQYDLDLGEVTIVTNGRGHNV